jgi:hypothetical protein
VRRLLRLLTAYFNLPALRRSLGQSNALKVSCAAQAAEVLPIYRPASASPLRYAQPEKIFRHSRGLGEPADQQPSGAAELRWTDRGRCAASHMVLVEHFRFQMQKMLHSEIREANPLLTFDVEAAVLHIVA